MRRKNYFRDLHPQCVSQKLELEIFKSDLDRLLDYVLFRKGFDNKVTIATEFRRLIRTLFHDPDYARHAGYYGYRRRRTLHKLLAAAFETAFRGANEFANRSNHTTCYRHIWLEQRKAAVGTSAQSRQRTDFDHEITLLSMILRYYMEYYDDADFRYPLKARHREDSKMGRTVSKVKSKDLNFTEFVKFREELRRGSFPEIMPYLATVQFFQALRISEAAALHWEDVVLDFKHPEKSRIRVCGHVVYIRKKGEPSFIDAGFKNASKDEPVKELPLFPEAYDALKALFYIGASGLVFGNAQDTFFSYREIQHAYDHAFARAGLPFTGTHVLRHGGTRNVYNETGDLAVAQQLLGNSDLESTLVYAKRHKSALTKLAETHWQRVQS